MVSALPQESCDGVFVAQPHKGKPTEQLPLINQLSASHYLPVQYSDQAHASPGNS